MEMDRLVKGLRTALLRLSLAEGEPNDLSKLELAREYWKSRHVVYHSWRHYFAAHMADRVDLLL